MPGGNEPTYRPIRLTQEELKEHQNPPAETPWKLKLQTDLNDLLGKIDSLKNEKVKKEYSGVIEKAMFATVGVIGLSNTLNELEAANGSGIREEYQKHLEIFLRETKTFIELAIAEEKEKEEKTEREQ